MFAINNIKNNGDNSNDNDDLKFILEKEKKKIIEVKLVNVSLDE